MTVGIIANLTKTIVREILPDFLEELQKKKIPAVITDEVARHVDLPGYSFPAYPVQELGHHCDVALAFGGDGTMLRAARDVNSTGVPLLGVNVGRFGFLTEISVQELYRKIDDLVAGNFKIESRMALNASVFQFDDQERQYFFALNDVVLHKGDFARVIMIRVEVGNEFLNTYLADGMIICTPTGSTAYSLSAGGPLLTPDMEALVITPICPHSLSQRPLVVRSDNIIRMRAYSEKRETIISVDGQEVMTITDKDSVEVRKADNPVRLVKISGNSFYQVLRTKLNWGEDPKRYFGSML